MVYLFLFSRRRRHTICALVTGVQTCALPISWYGEWLINAQGEDVVAGIRTPQYLTKVAREKAGAKPLSMEEAMPETFGELGRVFDTLENHYRDMQDIEFTVERGTLWMLPTRSGKRTAKDRKRVV